MNELASLAEQSLEADDEIDESAAQVAALMNTIMKLLGTLKNSFKNMKLYKGSDELITNSNAIYNSIQFVEPDVTFEYFRYNNGKTLIR